MLEYFGFYETPASHHSPGDDVEPSDVDAPRVQTTPRLRQTAPVEPPARSWDVAHAHPA